MLRVLVAVEGLLGVDAAVTETEELEKLEELWHEELKCQFNHVNSPCSVYAIARITSCDTTIVICAHAYSSRLLAIANPVGFCVCGDHPRDCWTLVLL